MKRAATTSKTSYKRRKTAPRTYARMPVSSYVARPPRMEWKYLDVAVGMTMDTAGALTLLNGLTPGTGASQRIGMNIQIMSVELRLLNFVTAGTGTDQVHRMALVMDRQCNATAMTGVAYLNSATIYGMRLLENRKRFKTFMDKPMYLNATAEPGAGCYTHYYNKFRRPLTVEYNTGNAGTVADIVSNSLYLYGIGSSAPGVGAGTCNGYARIRYTDM